MPKILNDEPTLMDRLDRAGLVRSIGDTIAQCDPPHVFGIHGDWGTGKTSFLHLLHYYLTKDCPQQAEDELQHVAGKVLWGENWKPADHVTAVWFEAWRYQHEQSPIVALLQEIRTQLPWYSKWLNKAGKLGEVAVRSALLTFDDVTKKIGIQTSNIQETGEKWERDHLASTLPSHAVRQHLEEALKKLLGSPKQKPRPRLVVLVDDLDRCEPTSAYRLLEGIKIYLNLPSCVFVLGMNQAIIEGAIAQHLAIEQHSELATQRAREYLEKLCKDIWHLPAVRDPANLVEAWLPQSNLKNSLVKILREQPCLPPNPRKIKAFTNVLTRYVGHLGDPPEMEFERQERQRAIIIVVMSCLYQFHQQLYRFLEANPEFYAQILRWAEGQPIEHDAFEGLYPSLVPDPDAADADEAQAAVRPTLVDAFADPERGNVLRVQWWICELGPLPGPMIEKYLLR